MELYGLPCAPATMKLLLLVMILVGASVSQAQIGFLGNIARPNPFNRPLFNGLGWGSKPAMAPKPALRKSSVFDKGQKAPEKKLLRKQSAAPKDGDIIVPPRGTCVSPLSLTPFAGGFVELTAHRRTAGRWQLLCTHAVSSSRESLLGNRGHLSSVFLRERQTVWAGKDAARL